MSALETYIKTVTESRGMQHKQALQTLRWYMKINSIDDLTKAINKINNKDYLRTLIEAGCRKQLAQTVTQRYDDITKRERGE